MAHPLLYVISNNNIMLHPNSGKVDLEREREREREKGVEKDGAWKDGQTLVSQVQGGPSIGTFLNFVVWQHQTSYRPEILTVY